MDLDPIHGYAPAPSQFELDDKGELGDAAQLFKDTKQKLEFTRRQALQDLMAHRRAAQRLNAARGATRGHAEPIKPAPKPATKSNLDMWS